MEKQISSEEMKVFLILNGWFETVPTGGHHGAWWHQDKHQRFETLVHAYEIETTIKYQIP